MGISWSREKDKFIFRITINVSQRKRKQPFGHGFMRICISVFDSIFEPIGMFTPLTIILKVMLKRMFSKE